jgi:hypothetical protein
MPTGNIQNPRPLNHVFKELQDAGFSEASVRLFQDTFTRSDIVLTDLGEIQSDVPLVGRTEGLGTTVQNITDTGNLNSLGNVNDTNTDLLTDGTGSPLAGGTLARIALDDNARLANSFRVTPVNATNVPVDSTTLSNDGVSHIIQIAAATQQFAPSTVAYNSASFDPGTFGTFIFGYLDPTFSGGALTPVFGVTPTFQASFEGFVTMGKITSVLGTAKTGGGNTGGTTTGGAGGRGIVQS